MERPTTYTSAFRCFVTSHGSVDVEFSDEWWGNMITLGSNVTITKYVPFGDCYSYKDDTIINEKDEYAICNYLKPGKGADANHDKTKYYGRKGDRFPEVYFSPDDSGNFKSSVSVCNPGGGWATIYDMDEKGDIKLSDVIDLINNFVDDYQDKSFDLHILTCLTYPGSREGHGHYQEEESSEDEYDDRDFVCRSCHNKITLYEDRYWNKGRQESICDDCWDGVPHRFKQYYTYVDGDNDICHFYNTDNGCRYGNDCNFKHV